MTQRRRARAEQYARRINAAAQLLASGLDVSAASRQLAKRHQLSERQARRYVERARDQGEVDVPGPKVVFTVKLPREIAQAVRQHAKRSERTIGALVAQALEEFLERLGGRSSGGR